MVDLVSTHTLLAVATQAAQAAQAVQAEKTVRSPLLYAWLTFQVACLLAVGYGLFRLVKTWRAKRHPRG